MKKKLWFLITAFVTVSTLVSGQENPEIVKPKFKFSSINQAGFLSGASDFAAHFQSVNGVLYKTFFAGLGVGIDYYSIRTAPVFLDVRKNLMNKPHTPFVYADIGFNNVWPRKSEMNSQGFESKYKGGLYYDLGVGYKIPLFKKADFVFSIGYNYKNYSKTDALPHIQIWPPPAGAFQEFEYELRRISVKAGLRF